MPNDPQRPSIGRIVHFYETPGKHDKEPMYGPYAAVVTATKAENERLRGDFSAMLKVFVPPDVSAGKGGDYYTTAEFSEAPAAGCWTWPPRV